VEENIFAYEDASNLVSLDDHIQSTDAYVAVFRPFLLLVLPVF